MSTAVFRAIIHSQSESRTCTQTFLNVVFAELLVNSNCYCRHCTSQRHAAHRGKHWQHGRAGASGGAGQPLDLDGTIFVAVTLVAETVRLLLRCSRGAQFFDAVVR